MTQTYTESFNKAQKDAVEKVGGRLLILAGAGSGKTKVLTAKIAHLIQHQKVPPEAILGLTFTRKAAEEMRQRLTVRIGEALAKRMMLSTFHSFCTFVLRREIHHLGYDRHFTIYDRQDVLRLLTSIARDILEHESDLPSLKKTLDMINLAKNRALSPEDMSGSSWHDTFLQQVFTRLNEAFRAYNAVDFDHLLYLTHKLFEQFPEVLSKYQNRFQHVLIDEYQDTNPVQAKIAEALCRVSSNLCVVGDDDQSIYSWRGADVNNILTFDHDAIITLEQNFRSTNTILRAANAVIHCNEKRHSKSLWSDKGDGELIELFYAPSEQQEAEGVALRLVKIKEQFGLQWKDFAVLYRSNNLARAIESAFLKQAYFQDGNWHRGIPYQVYGGDEFYEHKEIRDLLAYLRVLANSQDHEAIVRVLNYPRRGIGEQTLNALISQQREALVSLWQVLQNISQKIPEKAKQGIAAFVQLIQEAKEKLATVPPSSILEWLIQKINLYKAIAEEVKSDAIRKIKEENIAGLIASLREYETIKNPEGYHECLTEFLSTVLIENEYGGWNKREKQGLDHVHLMTFHSAKGLEFATCFLIGLEENLMPHERSVRTGQVEEERRLMYVAMTRAKQRLILSMAASRLRMGQLVATAPSPFLFEIPKEYLQMTRWDKYTHRE